jgi:hypothetical protein
MDIFENIQKELEDLVKSKQALIHRNKRKDAYSLSPDRLLDIYQSYFTNINQTGNYTFKFSKNDKNDLLFLFRVYFKFYVELNDNLMTVYEEFPKCFKILKEVNKKNHRHTPKTFVKNTIMYLSTNVYGTTNYLNGIPLAESLEPVQGTDIIPTTQINYQYIKPHKI